MLSRMKSMLQRLLLATCTGVAALPALAADVMQVEPGLYQVTMTRTNSISGMSTTETTEQCVEETRAFSPGEMLGEAEGCAMVEQSVTAQTMQFTMTCAMGGGQGRFEGQFQQAGSVGTGEMTMQMSLGEFNINMDMDWESKRVGDC